MNAHTYISELDALNTEEVIDLHMEVLQKFITALGYDYTVDGSEYDMDANNICAWCEVDRGLTIGLTFTEHNGAEFEFNVRKGSYFTEPTDYLALAINHAIDLYSETVEELV